MALLKVLVLLAFGIGPSVGASGASPDEAGDTSDTLRLITIDGDSARRFLLGARSKGRRRLDCGRDSGVGSCSHGPYSLMNEESAEDWEEYHFTCTEREESFEEGMTCRPGYQSIGCTNSNSRNTNCRACPPARYRSTHSGSYSACTACGKGKYASQATGQTSSDSCKDCELGRYQDSLAWASECMHCGPGRYMDTTGSYSPCKVCGIGKYSSGTEQTSNRRACPCQLEQLVAHRANFIKQVGATTASHSWLNSTTVHVQGGQREQYVSHPTRIDEYGSRVRSVNQEHVSSQA